MSQLVPTLRTTPTKRDFAIALLKVWAEATKVGAGILYAHFAGETGEGVHCYGWNLGNVKWTKDCGLDYQALHGVKEWVNGAYVSIENPETNPAAWFRVYPSLDEGMFAFVRSKRSGQWRSTWSYVVAGDAEGYATELRRLHYYTERLEIYIANMKMYLNMWMNTMAFEAARAEVFNPDNVFPVVNTDIIHTLDIPGLPGFDDSGFDDDKDDKGDV
jgi:hypothetical protein